MIKSIRVIDNFKDYISNLEYLSDKEKSLICNNMARYEPNDYYCLVQIEDYICYCEIVVDGNEEINDVSAKEIYNAFEKLRKLTESFNDLYISNDDQEIWG